MISSISNLVYEDCPICLFPVSIWWVGGHSGTAMFVWLCHHVTAIELACDMWAAYERFDIIILPQYKILAQMSVWFITVADLGFCVRGPQHIDHNIFFCKHPICFWSFVFNIL